MIKLYCALAFIVLLTFGLGSCQKDPALVPASLQDSSLIGKWYLKTRYEHTSTDTSLSVKIDTLDSFTSNDFFDIKADNVATYSSTLIGKLYDGYYSAITTATPEILTFKSGDFIDKFDVSKHTKDSLVIYTTQNTTSGNVTTTVADYYIYTH